MASLTLEDHRIVAFSLDHWPVGYGSAFLVRRDLKRSCRDCESEVLVPALAPAQWGDWHFSPEVCLWRYCRPRLLRQWISAVAHSLGCWVGTNSSYTQTMHEQPQELAHAARCLVHLDLQQALRHG